MDKMEGESKVPSSISSQSSNSVINMNHLISYYNTMLSGVNVNSIVILPYAEFPSGNDQQRSPEILSNSKILSCKVCNKNFSRASALRFHSSKHMD